MSCVINITQMKSLTKLKERKITKRQQQHINALALAHTGMHFHYSKINYNSSHAPFQTRTMSASE